MSAYHSHSEADTRAGGGSIAGRRRRRQEGAGASGHLGQALAIFAFLGAVLLLTYAVAEAAITVAPWGDSPRVFYAGLADVGLGLGTLLLALVARRRWRAAASPPVAARAELLVYVTAAILVAIPLIISASNSLTASASGVGGPSPVLEVLAGIALTASLALVMTRGLLLGFAVSGSLAVLLTAGALVAAR